MGRSGKKRRANTPLGPRSGRDKRPSLATPVPSAEAPSATEDSAPSSTNGRYERPSPATPVPTREVPAAIEDSARSDYRKAFYDQRKYLHEAKLEAHKNFDKTMITLSAGAFALSISYLKDLTSSPRVETVWMLHWAWISFGSSLVLILFSFLCSQSAWERKTQREDQAFLNEGAIPAGRDLWACFTACLNWACLAAFVLGVVLLVRFSVLNYQGKNDGKSIPESRPTTDSR
jgi:hypothetical protein